MTSNPKLARIAGLLYLIVAITGGFAQFVSRQSLIVSGDATATAQNVLEHETLYRIGIVSDLIDITVFLVLPLVLYRLLAAVNKDHALLMVIFVMAAVPIMSINMLNQFAALFVLKEAPYLTVFTADQVDALGTLFLDLHKYGYLIAQIFFGLWLFPLGYLVYKSGLFPKLLGVLLMLGTVGYLIDLLIVFLVPRYEEIAYPGLAVAAIGEFGFCLWLLIRGVKQSYVPAMPTPEIALAH